MLFVPSFFLVVDAESLSESRGTLGFASLFFGCGKFSARTHCAEFQFYLDTPEVILFSLFEQFHWNLIIVAGKRR